MGKRPTHRKTHTGSLHTPSPPPAGPPLQLRRLLRAIFGVELWHIEDPNSQAQCVPTIRYLVKRAGTEAVFNRPHEAWRYFKDLTGAPDKIDRPEPPQLNAALLTPGKRKQRRRGERKSTT